MRLDKAHALVDSIIETHGEAVGALSPEAREALKNARLDLHGLVEQIMDECRTEVRNEMRNGETTRED